MPLYHVTDNRLITKSVRLITLVCDDAKQRPFSYAPGQYAAISLHDQRRPTTTRCFSIVTSPTQGNVLQFSIRVHGDYTHALERLEVGDKVVVRGPFGRFVFNERAHHHVTLLAGGIGVAPFMSMLRYATDVKARSAIRLVYSCRSQDDVPFLDELRMLEQRNQYLHVTYVIGEGPVDQLRGLRVLTGYVNDTALNQLGRHGHPDETYMVCGPPPYMDAMVTLLKMKGVPKHNILTEAFSQTTKNQSSALSYTAFQTYAFSGVLLLVATGLIVSTDLLAAAPTLDSQFVVMPTDTTMLENVDSNQVSDITLISPQIDTSTTAVPVVVKAPTSTTPPSNPIPKPAPVPVTPKPTPVVTPQPKPVVTTPTPVVSPAPQPTKTTVPVKKPRTRVS